MARTCRLLGGTCGSAGHVCRGEGVVMADRDSFAVVVQDRLVPWRRMAFLMCGDWARAEDLVQTALLRMYGKWHRIDLTGVDAYARRVITRLAIDESRRAYRRSEVSSADLPDRPALGDEPTAGLDVRAALQRLSPSHRAVLVLRFYLDLSIADTAAALGVGQGTVKSQTSRGLTALRAAIALDSPAHLSKELPR